MRGTWMIDRQAAHGIFEADLQIVANVVAALGRVVRCWCDPAPNTSPNPNTSLRMSPRSGNPLASKPPPAARGHALMSEAVVGGALLRIAQNAIGLGGFLEFFFGVVIAGIAVGMMLPRRACGKTP